MSLFSARLTSIRKGLNLSRKEASNKLNLPYQTYSNYETGKREPDLKTMAKIAKAFKTTTDYLTGSSDFSYPANDKDTESDLDKMLDNAHSFDGKPMTPHDREIIRAYLEGKFESK